jgi:hypothetical protein
VLLNVSGARWDQFAYQFFHELCHIVTSFERREIGAPRSRSYQWFEETVCEVVSLIALNRLATSWKESPPHAGWSDYAPAFGRYARAPARLGSSDDLPGDVDGGVVPRKPPLARKRSIPQGKERGGGHGFVEALRG